MLHIILLILKIIGFLLLGILALILLLLFIVLLSPLVYRAKFSFDDGLDSMEGSVRFSWLMHLISGELVYHEGNLTWHIRTAWKRYDNSDDSDIKEAHKSTKDKKENTVKERTVIEKKPEQKTEEKTKYEKVTDETADRSSFFERLYVRWKSFLEKIEYTFSKFYDKIKSLKRKKERLNAFLQNKSHQNAFHRTVKETKRLLTFLKPKKASVDLEFGFSDPAHTGYALAGISLIYPVIGEYTEVRLDFDQKVLKIYADVKGRIRLVYGLVFAWNMIWDKNVRTTYRHIRKFRW